MNEQEEAIATELLEDISEASSINAAMMALKGSNLSAFDEISTSAQNNFIRTALHLERAKPLAAEGLSLKAKHRMLGFRCYWLSFGAGFFWSEFVGAALAAGVADFAACPFISAEAAGSSTVIATQKG